MARPRHRQRIRGAAGPVAVILAAALLSSITQTPASGADELGQGVALDRHDETGRVGFIGTRAGKPIDSGFGADAAAATVARSFLTGRAEALGLRGSGLRLIEKHATPGGGTAVRLAQTFSGVPVLGGEFVVTVDANNDVLSVLGEASPISKAGTRPSISAPAAATAAVGSVAKSRDVQDSALRAAQPELMFYDARLLGAPGPFQHARLAWVTEVRGTGRITDIGERVVVDAASGTVALSFPTIQQAKNRVVCDANNIVAADYPCLAPDRTEGSPPVPADDDDMELAFRYAGHTYDFFFTRFGRDSLDGAGMQLVSTTDYCPSPGQCPYQNAFWDGAQMAYGDGFATADDVVGHELTHGVTDFSSSLFYYQQSGAINESMSDVFGEFIDLVNGAGTDTAAVRWLMGEDLPPAIGAIRDMEDPPAFGAPDRMLSPNYYADPSETDAGGVHFNSGVNNKAAFLMVDGGSFNGQTITGLGITKAARIYYTVNNSMLVSGSDYADLANALRQACTNLVGTDGITTTDCAQVHKVVVATEMDLNPTSSPTRSAALCPTGSRVNTTVLADDLESPAGQFTTGGGVGWNYPQPNQYPGFDATYATSGDTNIWGDNTDVVSDTSIRMTSSVAVPADAYLSFNHAFGFEDDASTSAAYDGGVLEYSTAGAGGTWTDAGSLFTATGGANGYTGTVHSAGSLNPLAGKAAFVRESNGYGSSRATLTSLAGQNVMFRWRIGTDQSVGDYGWFLDDLRIVTCVADSTPPNTTITAGPAAGATTTGSTATFAFASTEAGSTFACSIDAGAFAPCLSPLSMGRLSSGAHTFSVFATDPAGNPDPSPATRSFTVDTTAPQTTITKHPKKKTFSHKAKFRFVSNEPGSTFKCKLDKKRWKSCSSPKTYKNLKTGRHKFRVKAIDAAGNADPTPAKWKWRIKP